MHLRRYLFRSGDGAPWWAPACVEWRGDTRAGWGSRDVLEVDCPCCLVLLDAALARGEVSVQEQEWPKRLWVHVVEQRDVGTAEAAS